MAKRSKCEQWYWQRDWRYWGTATYEHEKGHEQTVDILLKRQDGIDPQSQQYDRNFYFSFLKPMVQGGKPIKAGPQSISPDMRKNRTFKKAEPKGTSWSDDRSAAEDERQ